MMAYQEDIHLADEVIRTHEFQFLLLGQIAKIEKAKFSMRDQHAERG